MSYHTVVPGDTMWRIARENDMPLDDLIELNPQIRNPNLIFPGQRIRIADDSVCDDDDEEDDDDEQDDYGGGADDDDYSYGDENYSDEENDFDDFDDEDEEQLSEDGNDDDDDDDDDEDFEELYLDPNDVDGDGQDDDDQDEAADEGDREAEAKATTGLEMVSEFLLEVFSIRDAQRAYEAFRQGRYAAATGNLLLGVSSFIPIVRGGRVAVKAGAAGGQILTKRAIAQVAARSVAKGGMGLAKPTCLIVASRLVVPRNSIKHAMVARYLKYAPLEAWKPLSRATAGKAAKRAAELNAKFGPGNWEKVRLTFQKGTEGGSVHAFMDRARKMIVHPKFKWN